MSRSPEREGESSSISKMSKRKADRNQAGSPLKTDNEGSPGRKERKKKRVPRGSDDEDPRGQNSDGSDGNATSSPKKRVSYSIFIKIHFFILEICSETKGNSQRWSKFSKGFQEF